MASTENAGATRPHVFIQTNNKQSIGAIVYAYSMKRNSAHADKFDVSVIRQEDYPFFAKREGQTYMRHGVPTKTMRSPGFCCLIQKHTASAPRPEAMTRSGQGAWSGLDFCRSTPARVPQLRRRSTPSNGRYTRRFTAWGQPSAWASARNWVLSPECGLCRIQTLGRTFCEAEFP